MTTSQSPYEDLILNNPTFRARYDQIMGELLNDQGPMQIDAQIAFLYELEALLASALAADPNNNVDGAVSECFDSLRQWVKGRDANIKYQLAN